MTKIAVIIGTTRDGRITDRLASWAIQEVKQHADAEIVDLKDYPMPFIVESSPRYNPARKAAPEIQKWLDKIAEFDGYVIITPEYNRSIPGVLKNALDLLDFQMEQKPAAIISHGGNNGAQALDALRSILPQLGVVVVPQNVYFSGRVGETINQEGELSEELKNNPYGPQSALEGAVKQLTWLTNALQIAK